MSASEKLKTLDGQRRVSGASGLGAAVAETKLIAALPQIVAVLEAAERVAANVAIDPPPGHVHVDVEKCFACALIRPLLDPLAALDEALP